MHTKLAEDNYSPFTKSDNLFAELVWRGKMLTQIGKICYNKYYILNLSRYSVGLICNSNLKTLLKWL